MQTKGKGNRLTKEQFLKKIQEGVSEKLGDSYDVRQQKVLKNNGVMLTGLVFQEKGSDVSPTIYLDSFYDDCKGEKAIAKVVDYIVGNIKNCGVQKHLDMEFFQHFDRVKERICYKVINTDENETLLRDIPNIPYLNLSICFYYSYDGNLPGLGAILIHNSHMNLWNTSVLELYRLAKTNTKRLFPAKLEPMQDMLDDLMLKISPETEEEASDAKVPLPMYVLTNTEKYLGASCILYEHLLEDIAVKLQKNFYILPSSIHETILLEDEGTYSAQFLEQMVRDVNATQVEPQEFLSNRIYYFERRGNQIQMLPQQEEYSPE